MSTGELPQGWIETTLGGILELKYGKSLPERDRDGVGFPVFGSNGPVGQHSKPLVNTEGLIVGRKGSFGEVRISKVSFFPIDTTYYVDKFYNQPIKYWFYQLRFLPLTTLNRSTAIPGLNRDDAYDQTINFPSLAEQQQIATKLDELLAQVDSLKTRLDVIPKILKRFRQSVLAAAVSGKLTEGWGGEEYSGVETTLGEVSVDIKYGTSKKCEYEQGNTPVLRIPNIGDGVIKLSDLKFADFESAEFESLQLQKGDILIIRSNGSVDLVGKAALVEKNALHCLYAGYLIRLRFKLDLVFPKYLLYCIQSPQLRIIIETKAKSTSGVNNINSKELASLPIRLPNLKEQTEIVRRVEHLFAYADQIEQRVKDAQSRVNNLTQSILAKAFRGELTAEWREQNPDLISGENSAEALLARIRAEREVSGKVTKRSRKVV